MKMMMLKCHIVLYVTMATPPMTLHRNGISEQMLSWMMDEFIRRPKPDLLSSAPSDEMLSWMMDEFIRWRPKPDLLSSAPCDEMLLWMMDEFIRWPKPEVLLSASCDEVLSWRIGIWMEHRLVSDRNCNTANL